MEKGDRINFVKLMAEKAESLLWNHIQDVEDQALKIAEDSEKEPKAKVSIAFEWPVPTHGSKRLVKAKLTYSIKHEDTIESTFDPEQSTIKFEES